MSGRLLRASGYRDDHMNLPVPDVEAALPFYRDILKFSLVAREDAPQRAATIARDGVAMRLVENGGDPSQDGCAFRVNGLEALFAEFQQNGLGKQSSGFSVETMDGVRYRVFYVVAPDGLCYWFGEAVAEVAEDRPVDANRAAGTG